MPPGGVPPHPSARPRAQRAVGYVERRLVLSMPVRPGAVASNNFVHKGNLMQNSSIEKKKAVLGKRRVGGMGRAHPYCRMALSGTHVETLCLDQHTPPGEGGSQDTAVCARPRVNNLCARAVPGPSGGKEVLAFRGGRSHSPSPSAEAPTTPQSDGKCL